MALAIAILVNASQVMLYPLAPPTAVPVLQDAQYAAPRIYLFVNNVRLDNLVPVESALPV